MPIMFLVGLPVASPSFSRPTVTLLVSVDIASGHGIYTVAPQRVSDSGIRSDPVLLQIFDVF